MLKILTVPNPVLTASAKPISKIDDLIKKLIKDMEKTLLVQKDPKGVGLAAPQVGQALQLFIIKPSTKAKIEVFINPKILAVKRTLSRRQKSEHQATGTPDKHSKLEGCLSIPRIWAPIKRSQEVELEYQDENGKTKKKKFKDFKTIIVQHEIDHLNGILFTQRALEQKAQLYEEKGDKLEKITF